VVPVNRKIKLSELRNKENLTPFSCARTNQFTLFLPDAYEMGLAIKIRSVVELVTVAVEERNLLNKITPNARMYKNANNESLTEKGAMDRADYNYAISFDQEFILQNFSTKV
jgi:hypothetical protein